MSLRTNAIPDDFPHFLAWYGGVPDFEYLATSPYHRKKYSCKDHWFRMRQCVDARYYMHWHYADSASYTASAYMDTFQSLFRCRKIGQMPPEERPAEYKKWFIEKQSEKRDLSLTNDVWEYRQSPLLVGIWNKESGRKPRLM